MGKFEKKIITKMRNNPQDCQIEEVKTLAKRLGIQYRQPGTSHVTFRATSGEKVTIPAHKPIKPIYIKKFIALIDKLGVTDE